MICNDTYPRTPRELLEAEEIVPLPCEPEIDDSVKFCPNCERPNQFGELCATCEEERDIADELAKRGMSEAHPDLKQILEDEGIPLKDEPLLCAHCLLDRGRLEDQRRSAELRIQIFCHRCSTREARTPVLSAKVCGIHAQIVLDTWNMNGRLRSPGGYSLELSRLEYEDDSRTVDTANPDHVLLDRIFNDGEASS